MGGRINTVEAVPEANAIQTFSYPRCIFIRLCLWQTIFPPAERGAVQLELIWHRVTFSTSAPLPSPLGPERGFVPSCHHSSLSQAEQGTSWARQEGWGKPSEILCVPMGASLTLEKAALDWRRCTERGFPQFLHSLHSFTVPTKLKCL